MPQTANWPKIDSMTACPRRIAVLGVTGSIGRNTLEVARHSAGQLEIVAMSAHRRCAELVELAQEWRPRFVVCTDETAAREGAWKNLPPETELLVGQAGVERIVRLPEVD